MADQSTQYNLSNVDTIEHSSSSSGYSTTQALEQPIDIGGTYRVVAHIEKEVATKNGQIALVYEDNTYFGIPPYFGETAASMDYVSNEFTPTKRVIGLQMYAHGVMTATNIAIIPKATYDAGFISYQPYALPNHELTILEAEDRASLAEVVDSGTKNLLDFANLTYQASSNVTVNKTDTQITVTTNNNTWGNAAYKMTLAAGTYYYSCKISNLTVASGTRACIVLDSGSDGHGTRIATFGVSTGTISFPFVWTGGTLYIFYYPGYANTANSNAFTAAENMICTKAAFAVSPKFVPYAKSNYSLTQDKLNKCTKVLSSGSLNDLKDNEIYYLSSDVADMPTSERAWGFVRTTMCGDMTGIQEFFSVTEPRESYVRVLRQGVWQSWIKTGGTTNYKSDVTFTTANTYQKIASVTIPAGAYARISAGEFYSNGIPTGVIISKAVDVASITAGNTFAKVEQSSAATDYQQANLSTSTYFYNTAGVSTFNIFCKCGSSNAKNTVFVTTEILN